MKKLFTIITILISITINAQEMRAVWITNVDSDVMFTDENITEAMDYLESININVIFPVVWNKGYTLFPSEVMNDYFGVPISPQFTGRDPLKKILVEAHRNGIEVIPWFEFGFATSYSQNGGHIIAAYPDWALKNYQGDLVVKNGFDWMSGIHPEVQEFMIKLVKEVVVNYDVDGIQGDDRLPAMPSEGGYEQYTVDLYKSEHGGAAPPVNYANTNWMRWRADKLNEFFGRLRDTVKSYGEHLIVSTAPSNYPWGYENYLQDSKTWVESGIADNFIPQLYRTSLSSYIFELNQALSYVPNDKDKFFGGILAKSGSYVISASHLLGAVQANRDKGVMGETLFFYEALRLNNNLLGDTLKAEFYQNPIDVPYRNGNNWRPKAEVVNEDDAGAVLTGSWNQLGISGFKPNIYLTNSPDYHSIEYYFYVPFSAWFDVHVYVVPNTVNSTSVPHVVYHDSDSTLVNVDQKNVANKGWYKLGEFYLESGNHKILKISNEGVESGKYVIADAAMIKINRKLSPDLIITGVEEEKQIIALPAEFKLEQNYPNPFNPTTKIRFVIPTVETLRATSLQTKLVIYDILGREVTTLLNKLLPAGAHEIEFDASGLPSGVYIYRLTAGNYVASSKMMFLK